jgi:hypothetical protein
VGVVETGADAVNGSRAGAREGGEGSGIETARTGIHSVASRMPGSSSVANRGAMNSAATAARCAVTETANVYFRMGPPRVE